VLARGMALVSEALFPARCLGCGRRGVALCAACRAELPYLSAGVCARCASMRGPRGVCHGCRRLSPSLSVVRAAFAYEGAARGAVLALKFRSGRYLAPLMGELLREHLARRPLHADVVVPVPLAARRLRQRGYNQARLLADQVAASVRGTVVADALERVHRPAQQTLPAADRLHNLLGALSCPTPAAIDNQRVLLVDDVVTTGATLSACAEALADAGARRISALVFARDL
jgi:competence protein ComFC